MHNDYWLNRTLCQVLEEMRACYKTRNFASLAGLIEEAQSMGNRMESKLDDVRDLENMAQKKKDLQAELNALREQKKGAAMASTDGKT